MADRRDYLLRLMRTDWDQRARANADYYVHTAQEHWGEDEFLASGRQNFDAEVASDMTDICQGRDPKSLCVLEIGCGSGRMTGAFADVFGHVHGVDISEHMLELARARHAHRSNVTFHLSDGDNLKFLPDDSIDFAFSYIVFQQIPSEAVVKSYIEEVGRVLRAGCLFKFQVQRPDWRLKLVRTNTWSGVAFSGEEMRRLAEDNGMECRHMSGEGTQYFWLWFFKYPEKTESPGFGLKVNSGNGDFMRRFSFNSSGNPSFCVSVFRAGANGTQHESKSTPTVLSVWWTHTSSATSQSTWAGASTEASTTPGNPLSDSDGYPART